MSVYVDEAVWPFGRMMMCHMIADSHEELVQMADRIGVARRWIQKAGTKDEHFDICKSKRSKAVKLGAIELTSRELVMKTNPRLRAMVEAREGPTLELFP